MSNILLATWGSAGDILPFIAIGVELRKRGYKVTLIANPYFEAQATKAKLNFAPVGTIEEYQVVMSDIELWQWKNFTKRLYTYWLPSIEQYFEMIVKLHQPDCTALVASVMVPAARIAQEKLNIPLATLLYMPPLISSKYDPAHPPRPLPSWFRWFTKSGKRLAWLYKLNSYSHKIRRVMRAKRPKPELDNPIINLRSTMKLPPLQEPLSEWLVSPQLVIGTWPDWFAPPQPDWPKQMVLTGFPFYPPTKSEAGKGLDDQNNRNGTRPIVFTTGTVAGSQYEFFATAAETCTILGSPGILVTPHADHIPKDLPSNVTHLKYAPFCDLLPHSAAIVHHGGIGTTAYALASGIPQIVKPMAGDQFDTANRVERLGVGRMLTTQDIRPTQLASELSSILNSTRCLSRCKYWQSQVDPTVGLTGTADLVENLMASK